MSQPIHHSLMKRPHINLFQLATCHQIAATFHFNKPHPINHYLSNCSFSIFSSAHPVHCIFPRHTEMLLQCARFQFAISEMTLKSLVDLHVVQAKPALCFSVGLLSCQLTLGRIPRTGFPSVQSFPPKTLNKLHTSSQCYEIFYTAHRSTGNWQLHSPNVHLGQCLLAGMSHSTRIQSSSAVKPARYISETPLPLCQNHTLYSRIPTSPIPSAQLPWTHTISWYAKNLKNFVCEFSLSQYWAHQNTEMKE